MTGPLVLEALCQEGRGWLADRGWGEPPTPRWVEGELVVVCPGCGEAVPVEHLELRTFDGGRVVYADGVGALRRHVVSCVAEDA